MPSPMNRQANRFGAALPAVSAANDGTDSSHGSATVAAQPLEQQAARDFAIAVTFRPR